jgi:F-type H+-transporting ATPase subunit epsilon
MNTTEILLEIVSPDKTLVHRMVGSVSLPGTAGRFEILKNHAPIISSLSSGEIKFVSGHNENKIAIKSGFVEVNENKVSVCVEL